MGISHEGILQNRVAIITGAAKGIGRAIAFEMARQGAIVVLADIDEEHSHLTQQQIQQWGGRALMVPIDICDQEQHQQLVNTVVAQLGTIDILVNNVGIGIHTQGGIIEMTRQQGLNVLRTNLVEPLFLTQRVVKEMLHRQTKGCILFTSSIHGRITYLDPVYTSTKAALEMLVRDIGLELAEYGIRANAVAPGAIAAQEHAEKSYPFVPVGYKGTPIDVAHAMVFLASDKASYITGQTLTVDGGLSLAHEAYWDKKGFLKC